MFTPEELARNHLVTNLFLSVIFTVLFGLIYSSASLIYLSADIQHNLELPIDAIIPFLPVFALVYASIGLFLVPIPFLMKTPANLLPFGLALVFELIVAWFIFGVFPVSQPELTYDQTGFLGNAMNFIDFINLEGNQFPSLHVALAFSAGWIYFELLPRKIAYLTALWSALVIASTLFTHQHYIIDVIGGLVLALIAMLVVRPFVTRQVDQIKQQILKAS